MDTSLTRDQQYQYLKGLKSPELNALMQPLNKHVRIGMTNEEKITEILSVYYPPVTPPTTPTVPTQPTPDAPPPPAETKPEAPKQHPIVADAAKIDLILETLRAQLVEKVKEAAKNGVPHEIAEGIRAGAADFLKEANRVLEEARKVNETTKASFAQLNEQMQGIERAKADIERRSADYIRLRSLNAEQMKQIQTAQQSLSAATRTDA